MKEKHGGTNGTRPASAVAPQAQGDHGAWSEAALRVLRERYLLRDQAGATVETPDELCWRVARAVAKAEATWAGQDAKQSEERVAEIAARFAAMMIEHQFLPNSPTLMNAGKGNNLQLSACYVVPVEDSLSGIFDAVKHAALIHQSGGGTGMAFSRLRPEGSMVASTHGVASGPVSFMRIFDGATEAVKQGGSRRGANMGILRVDHPDIFHFIDCKRDGSVTNFNISVAITDDFMAALAADGEYDLIDPHTGEVARRVRAREVMDRIVDAAWATGDPGLVFLDRANHSTANPTPEIEPLEATNPCVIGETRLATEHGLLRMDTLNAIGEAMVVATDARVPGQELMEVINGTRQGSEGVRFHQAAPIARTGRNVAIRRLVTSHGIEIVATPNHRFLTNEGYKRLDALQYGDVLLLQSGEGGWSHERALPRVEYGERSLARLRVRIARHEANPPAEWSEALGEVVGYVLGDGYVRRGHTADILGIAVANGDVDVADHLRMNIRTWFGLSGNTTERQGHLQITYEGSPATFLMALGISPAHACEKRVPESVFAAPRDAVVGFLRGLFSADGSVQMGSIEKGTCSIRLATSSKGLAQDVQQLLLNLGIVSALRLRRQAQVRLLPDAEREPKEYATQPQYELIIDKANRDRFAEVIGFLQERKQQALRTWIANKKRASNTEAFTTKVALVEDAGTADVYDTTEPATHSLIVNGLATHNCGEQWLGPYDACNLGSINLGLFVRDGEVQWEELEATTRLATRFLDDVIEINPFPLPEVSAKVHSNRRIGLGIMGWAEMLFELGLRYDSEEATALGERVMVTIERWSTDESAKLAEERGAFPNFPRSIYKGGKPLRNATRTTVAPTGSISILADCSSGIEPIFALAYQHRVKQPDGSYRVLDFVNPYFERALQASDIEDKASVLEYAKTHGSLHGHPVERHPALAPFVTAHEIAPEWHIRMQAAFQKGVNNSISKCLAAGTLIPTSHGLVPIEEFSDVEEPDTFVSIADEGITTSGHRILSHYFAGEKPATRIRLDNGTELVGSTESHRVYTPDGWRRMADLRVGDFVVGRFQAAHGDGEARLPAPDEYRTNAKHVTIPERMTPELALFLGMMAADGHTTVMTGAVGLTTASDEVIEEFTSLAQALFGLTPRQTTDTRNPNVRYLTLNSRVLCRWVKGLIGSGAYAKHVPPQVLAGSAAEKLAFLRGVSLDGYVHPLFGLYVYSGMSQDLAYGVAEIARSFGLPLVRVHRGNVAATGNMAYKVLLSNEMQQLVTCVEPHKNVDAHFAVYQVLIDQEVVQATHLPASHPFYSAFNSIRQRQPWNCDNRTALRLGWSDSIPVHRVTAVEDAGVLPLYDIEVEGAHEYVVNGIVSHNTINLANHATRADVEAAYKLAWELGCLGITVFRDGCKGEQVLNVGVKQAEPKAATVADSGTASLAQAVSAVGGVTSMSAETPGAGEVNATGKVERAASTAPLAARSNKPYVNGVKERPEVVAGYTRKVRAPEGKVYVTLNSDEDGLLEVFLTIGKAGSDVAALADALGRLISLHLRIDSPISQDERAAEVAKQLRSIGGSSSIGFGIDRVRSLPDAVARAIELHLAGTPGAALPPALAPADAAEGTSATGGGAAHHSNGYASGPLGFNLQTIAPYVAIGNLCPQCGNNTLHFEEGCKKCVSCGYSEC